MTAAALSGWRTFGWMSATSENLLTADRASRWPSLRAWGIAAPISRQSASHSDDWTASWRILLIFVIHRACVLSHPIHRASIHQIRVLYSYFPESVDMCVFNWCYSSLVNCWTWVLYLLHGCFVLMFCLLVRLSWRSTLGHSVLLAMQSTWVFLPVSPLPKFRIRRVNNSIFR